LSRQEELLLTDEPTGNVEAESGGAAGAEKPGGLDALLDDRLPESLLDNVQRVHEQFLKTVTMSLSASLGFPLTGEAGRVKQATFGHFLSELPPATYLVVLSLDPYPGSAILQLGPPLVFPILEALLGARVGSSAGSERELTDIEHSVLDVVLQLILSDLRQAWRPLAPIEFRVEEAGCNVRPSRLNASEPILAMEANFQIGDTTGAMNLAVPAILVQATQPAPGAQQTARSDVGEEAMLLVLHPVRLRLEARVHGAKMQAGQLLAMKEGDVLTLPHPFDRPVDGLLNGKLKYKAQLATNGSKMSMRVADHCDSGE
jgi:flagellar motor switch protein FliM